ncbi:hypothetical protein OG539_13175 [Actinacidiphila glaucinigra]|nr:hypothetical protein [Actinacidiphila glaucinigra]WSD62741.1 hypothetical protein OIE69_29525 [Actinacidiphila glaucinigra]
MTASDTSSLPLPRPGTSARRAGRPRRPCGGRDRCLDLLRAPRRSSAS